MSEKGVEATGDGSIPTHLVKEVAQIKLFHPAILRGIPFLKSRITGGAEVFGPTTIAITRLDIAVCHVEEVLPVVGTQAYKLIIVHITKRPGKLRTREVINGIFLSQCG